nr:hypothetical protein [Mycobacterium paraense]
MPRPLGLSEMYTGPNSNGMFPVFIRLPVTVRGFAAVVVYEYSRRFTKVVLHQVNWRNAHELGN